MCLGKLTQESRVNQILVVLVIIDLRVQVYSVQSAIDL